MAKHLNLEVAAKLPAAWHAASGLEMAQWYSLSETPLAEVDIGYTAGSSVSEYFIGCVCSRGR